MSWGDLLEAIKRFRVEVYERLKKIEDRLDKIEKSKDVSGLIELSWRISNLLVMAQRLFILTRSEKILFYEFERDLRIFLEESKKLIDDFRNLTGSVDWKLIRDPTSTIISAAHRIGLPFPTIANLVVKTLGKDSVNVVDEEVVRELYGASAAAWWKKTVDKL